MYQKMKLSVKESLSSASLQPCECTDGYKKVNVALNVILVNYNPFSFIHAPAFFKAKVSHVLYFLCF